MPTFIGIDPAKTTGIAMWYPGKQYAAVCSVTGDPLEQWQFINDHILGDETQQHYAIERLHHFRNANTTRSLLERYGFLRYSLLSQGYQVTEVSSEAARKWLGVRNKREAFDHLLGNFKGHREFNDHESDALVLALYQADLQGYKFDPLSLWIEERQDYAEVK